MENEIENKANFSGEPLLQYNKILTHVLTLTKTQSRKNIHIVQIQNLHTMILAGMPSNKINNGLVRC